jgi:hypothetical protein
VRGTNSPHRRLSALTAKVTATWADACARQRPGHELLRHADTNNRLIDEVITYQADPGNFAQQPEHLQRVSDDER